MHQIFVKKILNHLLFVFLGYFLYLLHQRRVKVNLVVVLALRGPKVGAGLLELLVEFAVFGLRLVLRLADSGRHAGREE